MGVMLIGLGVALLAATHDNARWGQLALAGVLLHVWNHGAFKSLLFFGSGSILHATGTREMSRLGGLARTMPWTAGLFALGSVAAAGLPPLNGFVSEWLIYLGLFDIVTTKATAAWMAVTAVILLAAAGALALAAFAKACATIFLGAPRTKTAAHAHECGSWMRGPMMALATVCVLAGLAPVLFWPAISRAVAVWNPAWTTAEMPAPLMTLSAAQIILAVLVLTATLWLWRQARANGLQRGPTWDCGYAAPTARIQYTGGSFAGIVTGWFGWILQPERKLRRPRGYFPTEAIRLEQIPETVLERIVVPVGARIMSASTVARRLQHGRLQFYILYVVAGLAALGLLVVIGGLR
jgi:hydrogenase-4 component B